MIKTRSVEQWHVSSYSGAANNCVELNVVADLTKVRDSKSRDTGTLALRGQGWSAFLFTVKSGTLDL